MMNKSASFQYEKLEKKFMKNYGQVHACGECKHTTTCIRMNIQYARVSLNKKNELMKKLAPFVKDFVIEKHKLKNCDKILQFIKVYQCERFEFDGGK